MSDLAKSYRYFMIGDELIPLIHTFLIQEGYDKEFLLLVKAETTLKKAGFEILHPDMFNYKVPETNLEPEKLEGVNLSILVCEYFGCDLRYYTK